MKSRTVLVVLALLVTFAFSASAQDSSVGAPRMVTASFEHSFGAVKPGTPLKFTFQIKNEGKETLEIKNVAPSCGCTTSDYDKTIAPGKTGGITLEVAKTDGYSGDITKTATVTTNDPDHQSFTLTLKANFSAK